MGILRRSKHRIAYRLLAPIYDQVQTASEQVRQFCIREDGLNPARVRTIYNGIDPDSIGAVTRQDARQRLGIAGGGVVLTVANVRKVKGLDVLVRAAGRVLQARPDTTFLVVGRIDDRAYYEELLRMAKTLGIAGRICFTGPADCVPLYLSAADVFCLLSRSEGFSNALVEAMAASLPCVATAVGGNPEALSDGSNGYLVEPEDDAAPADRILHLLDNPATREAMGKAAACLVRERFTTATMVRALASSYEELLAAKTGAS
jgi:glycosyltransferase involved in cell wall biosynthesis